MNWDKFAITLYFSKEKSIGISCKDKEQLDDVLNKIETLKWFRTKDSGGDVIIQTSNILYMRVIEYAGTVNDENDDDDLQDDSYNPW